MTYRTRKEIEQASSEVLFNIDRGIEKLAQAVVVQAVRDYHHYKKKIRNGTITPYQMLEFKEVEDFFFNKNSALSLFTSLPADRLLEERGATYEEENN